MMWFALSLGTIVFLAFAGAIFFVFQMERQSSLMKLLSALSLSTFATYFWSVLKTPASELAVLAGLGVHVIAASLFGWAVVHARRVRLPIAFSSAKSSSLVTEGPYRFIRHPLYASYILYWVGCSVETLSIIVTVLTATLTAIYSYLAVSEEKRLQAGHLGSEYKSHFSKAGLFWPKF